MAALSTFRSGLRERFMRLKLRGKITAVLLAVSVLIGSAVGLAAYLSARYLLISHTTTLLASQAQLERREFELRLGEMLSVAETLANNSATANALADSRERDVYLVPLLRSQKLAIAGSFLSVTDYRGRTVASTAGVPPDCSKQPDLASALQSGLARALLLKEDGKDDMLLLTLPVHYRPTGNVEGSVLLHVPLGKLLAPASATAASWLVDASGAVIAGQPPAYPTLSVATPLALPPPLDGFSFSLMLAQDRNAALGDLNILVAVCLLLALLVNGGLVLLARVGARYVSAPLDDLLQAAEDIVATGRPEVRIPSHGSDEFGRLAAAFNSMVERLGESYALLEARVEARTRDLEESQQVAEKAGNLLREAVSSIAEGFTIYDENDRLVLCNEAYLKIYAASRDLIVPGRTFEDIVRRGAERGQYPDAVGRVDTWVRQRVAQHQNANGEVLEQQLADGRWLMIVEYRTPSGYIVGNRVDISRLKQAMEALAEMELRWEMAVHGANDGIWDWNGQTGKIYFSERWKAMLGYPPEEIGDEVSEWSSRVHPDDYADSIAEMQRHLRGETEFYAREQRVRCRDGSYKWILDRGQAIFDAHGRAVRMAGSTTDISERRAAEASIRDRTEQLNTIFSLSPDGFVAFDAAQRVRYVSPAFLRMTGLVDAELAGLGESEFATLLSGLCAPQASFPGFAALRAQQMADHGAGAAKRPLIELAAGGQRVLQLGLRLARSETVSQILYCRDVTHETEVDRMKSEFLSTAAHELRTPMASIYGYSELLLHETFPAAEQHEFLDIIYRQTERMMVIINELLDLARIESRRGKDFSLESLELHQLLHEVIGSFKPPALRAVPFELGANSPRWVRADRGKLIQAINNVLANAYKYSPAGGAVEIELVDEQLAGALPQIGIRISDQGIGMAPEQLARVCERFYRADVSGEIPGTGLGMSIVKEIIELHGGRIDMSSAPGCGSSFTLWLPAASAAALATLTVSTEVSP